MPLTEPQRAFLNSVETAKQAIENSVHQLSLLLRAVRGWDAGTPDPLIDEAMTADDVMTKARSRYAELRAEIVAAAEALPTV